MKRVALLMSVLIGLAILMGQVRIPGPGGSVSGSPAVNSIGPVDVWMTLAGTTAATNLTTAILNSSASTFGIANSTNWGRTGATNLPAAAHNVNCVPGGTIYVDGTNYATSQTTLSWNFPNSTVNEHFDIGTAAATGLKRVVAIVCYTSNSGTFGGSGVIDFIRMNGSISGNIIAQFSTTSKCGGTFGADLETIAGGTSNTPCNTSITQNGTFWYVLFYDGTVPTCTLSVYDTSFNQVGSTLTAASNCPTGDITSIAFGNNEAGTSTGTANIENVIARWFGEPPALNPKNTTQDPVSSGGQSHNNHGSGTQTTLATTKALDVPANWGQVVTVSNENASGAATGVTNTIGDVFVKETAASTTGNGQSMSQWFFCSSSARTAQTYTVTWPASQFSNIDVQLIPSTTGSCPSFDTGAVVNQATGATATTGTFTPGTSTGINVGMCYTQAGLAMTPGSNYFENHVSSSDSTLVQVRTNAPASAQSMAAGNSSSGNPTMCAVGNFKQ